MAGKGEREAVNLREMNVEMNQEHRQSPTWRLTDRLLSILFVIAVCTHCGCAAPSGIRIGMTEDEVIREYGPPKSMRTHVDGSKELLYVFEWMAPSPWETEATEEVNYRGDVVEYGTSLSKEWVKKSEERPIQLSKSGRVMAVPKGKIVRDH